MNILQIITIVAVGVAMVAWALLMINHEAGWAQCPECGVFHHSDGSILYEAPKGVRDIAKERQCTDCSIRESKRSSRLLSFFLVFVFSVSIPANSEEPRPLSAIKHGQVATRMTSDVAVRKSRVESRRTKPNIGKLNTAHADGVNFIDRIAIIESGNNSSAIGDRGKARGAWQMTERAWMDVNALRHRQQLPEYPWEMAHDEGTAREYALQYCGILSRQLRVALRRLPLESEIYCSFCFGFTGFKERNFSVPKSIKRKLK